MILNYLLLHLKARGCNALQHAAIVTPLPVLPCVLFVHALESELKKGPYGIDLRAQGVGIVYRDSRLWTEHVRLKNGRRSDLMFVQQRGASCIGDTSKSPKNPMANPMQPQALCSFEASLLIASPTDLTQDTNQREIESTARRLRLAGGVIDHARLEVFDSLEDARKRLQSRFWVRDCTREILGHLPPTQRTSALLKMACGPRKSGTNDLSWVMPVNLGWALLETPGIKRGVRLHPSSHEPCAHAFAEHLLGLVQLVPAAKARISFDTLWRYGWQDDQFLVTSDSEIKLSSYGDAP